jgi:hypothetical protein
MRGSRTAIATLILAAALAPGLLAQRHGRRAERGERGDWLEQCRRNDGGDRAKFCEERTMGWRAGAGSTLDIDPGPNGGVSVTGWDRDSVDVLVKLQASGESDDDARALAGRIRVTHEGAGLRVEGPATGRREGWAVSFEIRAPRRTDLTLTTMNGPLSVEDVSGRMQLSAVNGPVALTHLAGDVRAHGQNGPLHVALEGTRWEGAGLDAETVNGPVTLEVPENYNAQLETGTVNGPMNVGFPITVQGRFGGRNRRINVTLGQGGPTIRAVTSNGPAVLQRPGARDDDDR